MESEHLLRTMPEISLRIIEQIQANGAMSITDLENATKGQQIHVARPFKAFDSRGLFDSSGLGSCHKIQLKSIQLDRYQIKKLRSNNNQYDRLLLDQALVFQFCLFKYLFRFFNTLNPQTVSVQHIASFDSPVKHGGY